MTTRCKFTCQSVTKRKGWAGAEQVYETEFSAVTDGSEENTDYFAATPSGSLKIGVAKKDIFVPGKDYYIDITEAPVKE